MKLPINYENLIIAHRGIHNNKNIPENSMISFKKAIIYNTPIELDVQLTKDNQVIVFHDKNLFRMTKKNLLIKKLTLKELQEIPLLDTKEKIPTLQEVLKLVNNKVLLDIELKNIQKYKKLANKTLDILKKYKGQFIIKSFNPNTIKYLRKKEPNYKYGLLLNNKYPNFLITSNILIKYCKPDFLAIYKDMTEKKAIKKFHKKHPILLWTISNKKELKKYKHKNFSFICNNLPYR